MERFVQYIEFTFLLIKNYKFKINTIIMHVIWSVTHDCVIHTLVLSIISLRGLIMYSKPWFVIMHTRPHTVMNIYIIEDKKIHVTISMSLDINIQLLYGFIQRHMESGSKWGNWKIILVTKLIYYAYDLSLCAFSHEIC